MKKQVTVVVNGREIAVDKEELTFKEVVTLAIPNADFGPGSVYTVTYRRGHGDKPEGILTKDETLKIKDRMIIDVYPTTKS